MMFWRLRNFGKPPSIQWLRGIASLELMSNPTITRYEFVNGVEVNRRPANALVGFTASMKRLQQAFEKAGNEIAMSMARALSQPKPDKV